MLVYLRTSTVRIQPGARVLRSTLETFRRPTRADLSTARLRPAIDDRDTVLATRNLALWLHPELRGAGELLPPVGELSELELALAEGSRVRLLSIASAEGIPVGATRQVGGLSVPAELAAGGPTVLSSEGPVEARSLFFQVRQRRGLSTLSVRRTYEAFLRAIITARRDKGFIELPGEYFYGILELLHAFSGATTHRTYSSRTPETVYITRDGEGYIEGATRGDGMCV